MHRNKCNNYKNINIYIQILGDLNFIKLSISYHYVLVVA